MRTLFLVWEDEFFAVDNFEQADSLGQTFANYYNTVIELYVNGEYEDSYFPQ